MIRAAKGDAAARRARRQPAVLLLGPTGAGKSPLGDYLAAHGFLGRRCAHFDFGERLRRIDARGAGPDGMSAADLAVVRDALAGARLLENENFHIAERILRAFISEHRLGPDDLLVLNGLPRHVDQARDVDRIADVRAVINLDADAATVRERIRADSGGDRAGRSDDGGELVAAKLRTYRTRTAPILDHYRRRRVFMARVRVGSRMDAAAAADAASAACSRAGVIALGIAGE